MFSYRVANQDCVVFARSIPDHSVDLGIHDPPFHGIDISSPQYGAKWERRTVRSIIPGWVGPPEDHPGWSVRWMSEAKRILKPTGAMFVVSGDPGLRDILNAAHTLRLRLVNHIVWKYDKGIPSTRKFTVATNHVLYFAVGKERTFNRYCRFGDEASVYADTEDVFDIKVDRMFEPCNLTKLPKALVRKLIAYCSNPGDMVADFFLGNFTSAYCALDMNRRIIGCDINSHVFDYHLPRLRAFCLSK